MTTEQRIALYTEALLRWLAAQRDYPALHHPEPKREDYGLSDWAAGQVKRSVETEFKRTE